MHRKRIKKITSQMYTDAVEKCLEHKWSRADVLDFVGKYSGVPSHEILNCEFTGDRSPKTEAVKSMACFLEDLMESVLTDGEYAEDHIVPVRITPRKDGMNGKIREIANLCIPHQLLGHLAVQMLEPLLKAYLLPTQHASIPGRGQTRLKNQVRKWLRKKSLNIKQMIKIDIRQAYASTQYSVAIDIVRKLTDDETIIRLLEYLADLAPGGHLIIGGYLDAWLFNLVMADIIHQIMECGQTRRKIFKPYAVRIVSYMDDVAIFTSSDKATKRILKAFAKVLSEYGLDMKTTTRIIHFCSEDEENRRMYSESKSGKGSPCIDMAGYRIYRSHVGIRKRVFIRARRCLLRCWDELLRTGTVGIKHCQMLISYNGWLRQSDSNRVIVKYHANELLEIAKRVTSFHGYLARLRRKDRLYAFTQNRVNGFTAEGQINNQSRWLKNCPYI